jgi:hypothetical protein
VFAEHCAPQQPCRLAQHPIAFIVEKTEGKPYGSIGSDATRALLFVWLPSDASSPPVPAPSRVESLVANLLQATRVLRACLSRSRLESRTPSAYLKKSPLVVNNRPSHGLSLKVCNQKKKRCVGDTSLTSGIGGFFLASIESTSLRFLYMCRSCPAFSSRSRQHVGPAP